MSVIRKMAILLLVSAALLPGCGPPGLDMAGQLAQGLVGGSQPAPNPNVYNVNLNVSQEPDITKLLAALRPDLEAAGIAPVAGSAAEPVEGVAAATRRRTHVEQEEYESMRDFRQESAPDKPPCYVTVESGLEVPCIEHQKAPHVYEPAVAVRDGDQCYDIRKNHLGNPNRVEVECPEKGDS